MLAYRKPGERVQIAFPARYHTAEVSSLLRNVTSLYVPNAVVGTTGACCSDHQVGEPGMERCIWTAHSRIVTQLPSLCAFTLSLP